MTQMYYVWTAIFEGVKLTDKEDDIQLPVEL